MERHSSLSLALWHTEKWLRNDVKLCKILNYEKNHLHNSLKVLIYVILNHLVKIYVCDNAPTLVISSSLSQQFLQTAHPQSPPPEASKDYRGSKFLIHRFGLSPSPPPPTSPLRPRLHLHVSRISPVRVHTILIFLAKLSGTGLPRGSYGVYVAIMHGAYTWLLRGNTL